MNKKPLKLRASPLTSALVPHDLWLESRAMSFYRTREERVCFLFTSNQVRRDSGETLRELDNGPWK